MTFYICRKCSREFTYRSGLIQELICSTCVGEEITAFNKAEREKEKAIIEHEKSLYGEDVYLAYSLIEIQKILSSGILKGVFFHTHE